MSELKKLEKVGKEFLPIIKELFELAKKGDNEERSDEAKKAEQKLVKELKEIAGRADGSLPMDVSARMLAMIAARSALAEIEIQAMTTSVALDESLVRLLKAEQNTLTSELGRVGEVTVWSHLANLLTPQDIARITRTLEKADEDIKTRKTAKKILDTVVDVVIIAAKLAATAALA